MDYNIPSLHHFTSGQVWVSLQQPSPMHSPTILITYTFGYPPLKYYYTLHSSHLYPNNCRVVRVTKFIVLPYIVMIMHDCAIIISVSECT